MPVEKFNNDDKSLTSPEIKFLTKTFESYTSNNNSKKKYKGVSNDVDDDENDDYGTNDGDATPDDSIIMGSSDDINSNPHIDGNTNNDINFKINANNKNRLELLEKLKIIDEYVHGGEGNDDDSHLNIKSDYLDELSLRQGLWKGMGNFQENENENYPVGTKRNALISAISRRSRKAKEKAVAEDFVPSISAGESHGRSWFYFILFKS